MHVDRGESVWTSLLRLPLVPGSFDLSRPDVGPASGAIWIEIWPNSVGLGPEQTTWGDVVRNWQGRSKLARLRPNSWPVSASQGSGGDGRQSVPLGPSSARDPDFSARSRPGAGRFTLTGAYRRHLLTLAQSLWPLYSMAGAHRQLLGRRPCCMAGIEDLLSTVGSRAPTLLGAAPTEGLAAAATRPRVSRQRVSGAHGRLVVCAGWQRRCVLRASSFERAESCPSQLSSYWLRLCAAVSRCTRIRGSR